MTTRDNTFYEILRLPPGTGDNECIKEAAGKLLADIPFVVSYMERCATEEVECWSANWKAHGDDYDDQDEHNKIQFFRIMQAYAHVSRYAREHSIAQCKRAHDGQDIIFTPLFLKFKDFNISFPIFTSLGGSSDKEILIVSPIPSIKSDPRPIDDFILPETKLPASVIPRCKG